MLECKAKIFGKSQGSWQKSLENHVSEKKLPLQQSFFCFSKCLHLLENLFTLPNMGGEKKVGYQV